MAIALKIEIGFAPILSSFHPPSPTGEGLEKSASDSSYSKSSPVGEDLGEVLDNRLSI